MEPETGSRNDRKRQYRLDMEACAPSENAIGEFRMIPKAKLHVDPAYQRPKHESHVNRISKDLRWCLFGSLTVVSRGDGGFFVIDGQHRKLAADLRDDVSSLPCLIFPISSIPAEAWVFTAIQENRKHLTAFDRYHARLAAKEPAALQLRELLMSTEYEVSPKSGLEKVGVVTCVQRLLAEFERDLKNGDHPLLADGVWDLIITICNGRCPHNRIVSGVCHLERQLRSEGQTLLDGRNSSKLISRGQMGLLKDMAAAADYLEDKTAACFAQGLLKVVNRGRKTKLASIDKAP